MFFLEDYMQLPMFAVLFVTLLLFTSLHTLDVMLKKGTYFTIKRVTIAGTLIIICTIIVTYFLYQSAKKSLKEDFRNTQTIVCHYKESDIIISKENYTLKGDYFIKNSTTVINIDSCKSLKE